MKCLKSMFLGLVMLSAVCLAVGCSTDLDEVNERLDSLEVEVSDLRSAVRALQAAYDAGKLITKVVPLEEGNGGWEITFSDNSTITLINGADGQGGQNGQDGQDGQDPYFQSIAVEDGYVVMVLTDGTTFRFRTANNQTEPRLLTLTFRAADNSMQLVDDATCTIGTDDVVECWVPNTMGNKQLVPVFTFDGDKVTIDGSEAVSGQTVHDFKAPVRLTVASGEQTKEYTVYVHAFTGLPVLWIETEGRQEITSKDVYLKAHLRLVEDVVTRAAGDVIETDVNIKGRGNTTWGMDKKPYRLKFDEKVSLLDEPKDKAWVLLANYSDKTSLRNSTAFYMGELSQLDYTPRFHFVDLMLNGRYNGTYQLGDKLKISKNRVNVGDDGFLLEIDAKASADEITFSVAHIDKPINIKDPDVEVDDDNYNYVKDFVSKADAALFADNFTDPDEGWQKYMDMASFVDWYLINEIAKNNDAIFYTSCYMNLERGGKLKMGPLWDFDIAFGNVNFNGTNTTDGFWIRYASWYRQLFKDPAFVAKVKERFDYFYSHKSDIMQHINDDARYLRYSIQENESKWGTLYNYTWPNYDIWGSYQNEVQYMKQWLDERMEWLRAEFGKM